MILTTLEEINLQVFGERTQAYDAPLKMSREFPNRDVTLPDREWPVNVDSSRPIDPKQPLVYIASC